MKTSIIFLFCLLCVDVAFLRAQSMLQTIDVPTDPQSVAMGESFTGLPANRSALMYNPAGLTGLTGVTASYNQRNLNWFANEIYYLGVNTSLEVPFGVFAAHYNRLSFGTAAITSPASPDIGEEISVYQFDVSLGFGMIIANGLSGGLAAKYYDYHFGPGLSTVPAWLFDIGLLYSLPSLHEQSILQDNISLGASIQNLGTKFKVHAQAREGESELAQGDEQLLQFARIGIGYSFSIFRPDIGGFTPLAGVLTAEFRELLNAGGQPGDFWGYGAELTFYDILTLRGGCVHFPFSGIYGEDDTFPYRYGAGITLPLEHLGIPVPLRCAVNYTAIPLRDLGVYILGPQRMLLDCFSFEVQYTGEL